MGKPPRFLTNLCRYRVIVRLRGLTFQFDELTSSRESRSSSLIYATSSREDRRDAGLRVEGGEKKGKEKGDEEVPLSKCFAYWPPPSEVLARVFCITLYANETYALAAPHNKLLV